MRSVTLGPRGRLITLEAMGVSQEGMEPLDWDEAFAAAGLDPAAFTEVEPVHLSPVPSDSRRAWTGFYPDEPEWALRIEAASLSGVPVWFQQFGPWDPTDQEDRARRSSENLRTRRVRTLIYSTIFLSILSVLLWMSRRNLRAGRADRRGAVRLSLFLFVANLVFWLFHASHVGHWGSDGVQLLGALSWALGRAFFAAILFLALEPHVRRYWPDRIISWTRLLSGRWRDPLVGRDLLYGTAVAIGATLAVSAFFWVVGWRALDNPHPALADSILSARYAVAHLMGSLNGAVGNSLIVLAFLVLLRVLLRVAWLATILWVTAVGTFFWGSIGSQFAALPVALALSVAMAFVIYRFGLLAYIVTSFWFFVLSGVPVTTDFNIWYSTSTMVSLGALLAFVLASFAVATRGQFSAAATS